MVLLIGSRSFTTQVHHPDIEIPIIVYPFQQTDRDFPAEQSFALKSTKHLSEECLENVGINNFVLTHGTMFERYLPKKIFKKKSTTGITATSLKWLD